MRNLVAFIWKYHFFFLFLLLEIIAFSWVFRNNKYQRAKFVNSSNLISGNLYEYYNGVSDYLYLKEKNKKLADENARLHNALITSYMKVPYREIRVNDTLYRQQYEFVAAKVVNNSTTSENNYLTLNIGSRMGIKPDMAVISSEGIVGIVKDVSENFCSVMSLLHKKVNVNVKIKRDGSFGPLSWTDEDDYRTATLKDIPVHLKILKGDTIVTSAYSATFPENVAVGIVESYSRRPGQFFYTVKVRLSTDFKKLQYVYVVKNLMKEEQKALEEKSQYDR